MLAAIGFFLRFFETDLIRLVLLCQPIQYVQGRLTFFFCFTTNVDLHFLWLLFVRSLFVLALRSRFIRAYL